MKKLLVATALLLLGTAGTAAADHRGGRDNDRRERVTVRDRGNYNNSRGNRQVVRDRGWNNRQQVRDRGWNNRRPVYVNNDRYHFHGGRSVVYRRPVIQQRYYNYRVRPTVLVENYETVPGYTWTQGNWQWNGYEWNWVNGHYDVDASYSDASYGYDNEPSYNYSNVDYDNSSVGDGCDH